MVEAQRDYDLDIYFIMRDSEVPPRYINMRLETHPSYSEYADAFKRAADALSSVYLYGDMGVGKTGLAVGLLRAMVETGFLMRGQKVKFVSVPTLLSRLRGSYGSARSLNSYYSFGTEPQSEWDIIAHYVKAGALVMDDIHLAYGSEDWMQDKLYTIINERYNHERTTIFTSELGLKGITNISPRLRSRIYEMCGEEGFIEIKGKNLRATPPQRLDSEESLEEN